jgi:hypothetical protein
VPFINGGPDSNQRTIIADELPTQTPGRSQSPCCSQVLFEGQWNCAGEQRFKFFDRTLAFDSLDGIEQEFRSNQVVAGNLLRPSFRSRIRRKPVPARTQV